MFMKVNFTTAIFVVLLFIASGASAKQDNDEDYNSSVTDRREEEGKLEENSEEKNYDDDIPEHDMAVPGGRPHRGPFFHQKVRPGHGDRRRKRKEKRRERNRIRKQRRRNRFWNNLNHHQHSEEDDDHHPNSDHHPSFWGPHDTKSNLQWLHGNVSSIWTIINRLQSDISELQDYNNEHQEKRRKGYLNQSKNNVGVENSKIRGKEKLDHGRQSSEERTEDCPEEWPNDPKQCADTEGLICSGRGDCICGQCYCSPPYYGQLCMCSDDACDRFDGLLCGGSSRGQCRCNECRCRPNFTGTACQCSLDIDQCVSPSAMSLPIDQWAENLCSSRGACECNQCECEDGYSGKYCQDSIFSANICERLKSCVLCKAFGADLLSCKDCNIKINKVKSLELITTRCLMVHKGCLIQYGYKTPNNTHDIYVPEENQKCENL